MAPKKPLLKKPTVVSFLNYKGGVGKTNVSVNFAYWAASDMKLKTLLIDWDPQGDATEYLGVGRDAITATMFDVLAQTVEPVIGGAICETPYNNLFLIGANANLKNVETLVARSEDTFEVFRDTVLSLAMEFDLVVIDCPPANSHVNIASLFGSTDVFVVTTPASDSIDKIGLVHQMIDNIRSIIENNAPEDEALSISRPELKGIILTMGVENTVGLDVAREYMQGTWQHLPIEPMLPRAVAAQYSVSECVPILKSKPQEKLSRRYCEVFTEVLNRVCS